MADCRIVTVTLNPAMDRVLEAPGFAIGAHAAAKRVALYPAGKGINASRVLAMLGVRSIAAGFIGKQDLAIFEEYLERLGSGRIVMQLLAVHGATRDNITIVDPVNDTETHIREEGFKVQREDVHRVTSKLAMLSRPGTIVAFSGSCPPGVTSSDFLEMVRRCRRQGARVCVDTSGAPLETMRGQELWMAKLNQHELGVLSGRDTDSIERVIDAAKALSAASGGPVECVCATMGEHGAVLACKEGSWRAWAPIHPGLVVSTVGCGDALLAGMFAILQSNGFEMSPALWERALREGVAAATINATKREAGNLSMDEMESFREIVEIEPV